MKIITMTLVVSMAVLTSYYTAKAEKTSTKSPVIKKTQTAPDAFARMWTDTAKDTYLKVNVSTGAVDYFNVGVFGSKKAHCEKALFGLMQHNAKMMLRMEKMNEKNATTGTATNKGRAPVKR